MNEAQAIHGMRQVLFPGRAQPSWEGRGRNGTDETNAIQGTVQGQEAEFQIWNFRFERNSGTSNGRQLTRIISQ